MKNETDALRKKIAQLEEKRAQDLKLLKGHLNSTFESLAPINLIKSTYKEISSSPEIKGNILSSLFGITTSFLFKKLLVGRSNNPVKKLFGTLVQFVLANVLSKHAHSIKSAGENLLDRYLSNGEESKSDIQYTRR